MLASATEPALSSALGRDLDSCEGLKAVGRTSEGEDLNATVGIMDADGPDAGSLDPGGGVLIDLSVQRLGSGAPSAAFYVPARPSA